MMMMKGVLVVVLLMMVSSVSSVSEIGYSYCSCSIDGRVVTGTIVTSPDGSGSICTCPGSQQQPPETPTPAKNPPSHHHGGHHHHRGRNPPLAPVVRNAPQPQHPTIQLPPIPFMDPRAQSCLQEFLDSNACMAQVDEAYRYQNHDFFNGYMLVFVDGCSVLDQVKTRQFPGKLSQGNVIGPLFGMPNSSSDILNN